MALIPAIIPAVSIPAGRVSFAGRSPPTALQQQMAGMRTFAAGSRYLSTVVVRMLHQPPCATSLTPSMYGYPPVYHLPP